MGFHLSYKPYLPNHLHCSDHFFGGLGADKIASLGSFGSNSGSWRSSGSFRNAAVSSGCGTCNLSLLYSYPFRYYILDYGDPQNVWGKNAPEILRGNLIILILNLIDDKLDLKIRNVKIRTIWDVMKRWTEVGYTARIQHLMDEFHLSYSRIEDIINIIKSEGVEIIDISTKDGNLEDVFIQLTKN